MTYLCTMLSEHVYTNVKCFHWDTDEGVNDLSGFNGCNTSESVYEQWRHLHHNWKHFNVSCCLVLNSDHIWISTCWLNLLRAHLDIYMLIELTQSTSEYLHADWTYSEHIWISTCWLNLLRAHMVSTCWLNLLRAHLNIYMLIELTQSTSGYLHDDWTYSEHIWISTCWLDLLRAHLDIYMLIGLTQSTSGYLHADWTYSEHIWISTCWLDLLRAHQDIYMLIELTQKTSAY